MSARQDNSVFGCCVANYTLPLGLISYVCCGVVNTVDIIQVKDRVIVLYIQWLAIEIGLTKNFCLIYLNFRLLLPSKMSYPYVN